MGALFGRFKKHHSRVTEQDKAILQVKEQRDKLKQYQKKIEVNIEKEVALAIQLIREAKKEKAKLILKKKRYQETLLDKTDNQLDNLQRLVNDLEFAQVQMQVIEGLKAGNQALKQLHQILSLDDVEKIMDETREGIEYQNEIDELLSGNLTQEDEDAVLAELAEITRGDQEEEEEPELQLPEIPKGLPAEKKNIREKRQKEKVAAT